MEQNSINFLHDSFIHHRDLTDALDRKASFFLAISGVIFALSISRLGEIQFLVIAISSLLSLIFSVLVIRLPYRGKIKEKFGLMCWWGFADKSLGQYKDEIGQILGSDEKIIEEYKKEIWSIANYSLKPKTILLKWTSYILVAGLLIGFILFFI
jgi:hypothetical protein